MTKNISKKALSAVLAAMMTATAVPAFSASAESTELFPYAMFAGSAAANALTINTGFSCVNGKLGTNGTIDLNGSGIFNGGLTENAGMNMIFAGNKIDARYFAESNAQIYSGDFAVSNINVNLNRSVVTDGNATLDGNVNMNGAVKAQEDINITGWVSNVCSNSVLYSQYGDIKINTNFANLSGIIYAPFGNVEIDARYVNLNNTIIIADTITINALCMNANYGWNSAGFIGTESEDSAAAYKAYNMHVINKLTADSMKLVQDRYQVTEREVEPKFANIVIPGAGNFDVKQYDIEGVGNLSVMVADVTMPQMPMQMLSYILTPYNKDIPMLVLDFMYYNDGRRESHVEFYDLVPDKTTSDYQNILATLGDLQSRYTDLTDLPLASEPKPDDPESYKNKIEKGLYKSASVSEDDRNSTMFLDAMNTLLDIEAQSPELSVEGKQAKLNETETFIKNLLKKPGFSTQVFLMALKADTETFFKDVFYGTSNYQLPTEEEE